MAGGKDGQQADAARGEGHAQEQGTTRAARREAGERGGVALDANA